MTHTTHTIPFGPDHTVTLLSFMSMSRADWQALRPFRVFNEHGIEHKFYALPDGRTVATRTDKYTTHTRILSFNSRDTANDYYKNVVVGTHDIENGNADFSHQRSPSTARENIAKTVQIRNYDQQDNVWWWRC